MPTPLSCGSLGRVAGASHCGVLEPKTCEREAFLGFCQDLLGLAHSRHGGVDACRRARDAIVTRVGARRVLHDGSVAGFGPNVGPVGARCYASVAMSSAGELGGRMVVSPAS